MSETGKRGKRRGYHHGNLRETLVQAALETFPGAKVGSIRRRDITIAEDDAVVPSVDEDC